MHVRPLSTSSILEIHFGRRRPSLGSRRRCLMAGRMLRKDSLPGKNIRPAVATESLIDLDGPLQIPISAPGQAKIPSPSSQLVYLLGKLVDGFCNRLLYPRIGRASITIWLSSLSAYTMSWCRYQSMHLACGGLYPPRLNVSDWNLVLTSKSWSPSVPLSESHDCMQKEPSALACDIANPFPPDLWGYMHGFGYYDI